MFHFIHMLAKVPSINSSFVYLCFSARKTQIYRMYYYRNIADIELPNNCFVANIQLVDNFQNFVTQCYERLKFPDYYGFNSDALLDCLLDFSWLKESTIIIIFDSASEIEPDKLKCYVQLVKEVEKKWSLHNQKYSASSEEMYEKLTMRCPWLSDNEVRNIIMPRDIRFYFHESNKIMIEEIVHKISDIINTSFLRI